MGVRLSRRSACCRRGFLYVDPGRHVPRPARCPDRGGRDPETASPEPARTPGGRTYLQLTGIDPPYAGRLYDVFPGGCVTYGVRLPARPARRADDAAAVGDRLRAGLAVAPSGGAAPGCSAGPAVTGCAPATRLRIGLAGLALSGLAVRGRGVGRRETSVFRAINGLPDVLLAPAWPLMQAGSLAAVPVSAGVAAACGRPELATRLLAGGLASWTLAKAVKVVYRRPRPRVLVQGARSRGRKRGAWATCPGMRRWRRPSR